MFQKNKINRFIAFNLFIFCLSVYLLTAAGLNYYHTDASQLRFQVARSIVERAELSVSEGVGLIGDDGRKYSWLAIGSSIIALPFYICGKLTGAPENAVLMMNQFAGAAVVVLIYFFCNSLGYTRRTSLLVSMLYAFGTIAWPMAKHPFDNPVETFFILLSVYFMYLHVINGKVSHLMFSSLSLGCAFITRPISILVAPALGTMIIISLLREYGLRKTLYLLVKKAVLFSIAFLPFLVLIFWYNYYRFGSVFETGYQLMSTRAGIELFSKTSIFKGLSGLLVSPGKGYFYYSPVAIFFFFSIKSFMKKHMGLSVAFVLIIVSYVFFYSKYIYWHGDFAWGPRYMLAITPLLIIPIAELIDSNTLGNKKLLRVIVYSIFTVSVIIQIAAISVDFQKYYTNLKHQGKITFVQGEGVPPILVPPDETYFDWHKSPLLTQFKFIHEISKGIKDYRYARLPYNASEAEKMRVDPIMNVFDFWWLYNYFIVGTYSGIYIALMLLFIAIFTVVRLWSLSYRC